jgi:hypothetical protein
MDERLSQWLGLLLRHGRHPWGKWWGVGAAQAFDVAREVAARLASDKGETGGEERRTLGEKPHVQVLLWGEEAQMLRLFANE